MQKKIKHSNEIPAYKLDTIPKRLLVKVDYEVNSCPKCGLNSNWKTFREAELESAKYIFITNETLERYRSSGYPDEPRVCKLIGAIMVTLNAADPKLNVIKDYVLSQYFLPNTVDCLYKQHTKECLDRNVASLNPSDRLGRAYQTFQCYYRNFGGINKNAVWVPYPYNEVVQMLEDCLYITSASNENLLQYCQGGIYSNLNYPDIAYCFSVRAGLFDQLTGFNVQQMYLQLGVDNFNDGDAAKCIAEVVSQYCKVPNRTTRIFLDCVVQYIPGGAALVEATSNILGNPPQCVVPPSPPPKTQPFYNCPCS